MWDSGTSRLMTFTKPGHGFRFTRFRHGIHEVHRCRDRCRLDDVPEVLTERQCLIRHLGIGIVGKEVGDVGDVLEVHAYRTVTVFGSSMKSGPTCCVCYAAFAGTALASLRANSVALATPSLRARAFTRFRSAT